MTRLQLTVSDLMEGGLAKLSANRVPAMAYIVADVLLSWAFLKFEANVELHRALTWIAYLVAFFLLTSMFTLAIGVKLRALLRDPEELLTRIVFALVAWIVTAVGAGVGFILLVVPGLYLSARWFVAAQLILLDGAEIVDGLGRSWDLTEQSAWSIVVMNLLLFVPSFLPLFTGTDLDSSTGLPSLGLVVEWVITSTVGAFGAAVGVYAWHRLTGQIDELEQTFA